MKSETKGKLHAFLTVMALGATLALGLAIVLSTPRYSAAVNNAWGIVKGVNGAWPIIQCGSGSTPQTCTEHWVLGSGSQDPPSGYGADGDLFWRTDLLAFRTKTAGVWGTVAMAGGSETLTGTMTADRYEATSGTGAASNVLYDMGISSTHTGMFRGTNSGVGFAHNSVALMQCYASSSQPTCDMTVGLAANTPATFSATGYTYSAVKNLNEGSATTFARMTSTIGNGGEFHYCIFALDAGTGRQFRCGEFKFGLVVAGGGGTETCVMFPAAPDQTNDDNAGALTGATTLTYTFSVDTATPTDGCDFRVSATSSLTQTALVINWTAFSYQSALILPQ